MAQRHEQMMAEMKARDEKLGTLVNTMDRATGEARIETMAALLRELVQDQKQMHARMGEMFDMSQHMMNGRGMMQK